MIYTKVFQHFKGQFFILIISAVHIHSLYVLLFKQENSALNGLDWHVLI